MSDSLQHFMVCQWGNAWFFLIWGAVDWRLRLFWIIFWCPAKLRKTGVFSNDSKEVEAFVVVIRSQSPLPSTLKSPLAQSWSSLNSDLQEKQYVSHHIIWGFSLWIICKLLFQTKSLFVHTLLCAWLYQIIAVIWSASFEGPDIQRHGLLGDMNKKTT